MYKIQCTRILLETVSDEKIRWYVTITFLYDQLGLCPVSYTANEYSIYHFCIMIKDFSIFFQE